LILENLASGRILIVDDQEANVLLLESLLLREGYNNLLTTTDPRECLVLFETFQPDLLLLDLHMPHLDGFQVMEQLRPLIPPHSYLPVLVLTADVTPEVKQRALARGASDFLTKPFDTTEVLLRLRNLLQTRQLHLQLEAHNETLVEKVHERTLELQTLHRLSEVALEARSLHEAFQEMVEEISAATGFPLVAIELYEPSKGKMLFEGATGIDVLPDKGTFEVPVEETLSGVVARTGRPMVETRALERPEYANETLRQLGVETFVCVPMIAGGHVIGTLSLAHPDQVSVDDSLPQFASSLANHVTSLIERKRAEEQVQLQVRRLAALRAIDMAITATMDLRVALDVILDQVTSQLGVDAAAVLLLNQHTHTLEYAAGRGFHTSALRHTRLRLGEGYAGRAALERDLIRISNLPEIPGEFDRAPLLPSEAFVAYYGVPLITYYGAPLIAKGQVRGVLELFHRAPLEPAPDWLDFLEAIAGQAAIAIDNGMLLSDLQRANVELVQAYDTTLEGWSRALDLRDRETEGHTQRVAEMTLRLARALGMPAEELVHIHRGALLHDIGKMGIPDAILLKPGPLDDDEWAIMRQHPVHAYNLLASINFLRPALDIPYCHHEKWDGTGYPRGLKRETIPLGARVFAVIDVWDALRTERPYRAAWPEEKVRAHLRALAGSHFDPRVVGAFLTLLEGEE
jgi:response regulator RpfG family c-di-GMP phosphodiesterase